MKMPNNVTIIVNPIKAFLFSSIRHHLVYFQCFESNIKELLKHISITFFLFIYGISYDGSFEVNMWESLESVKFKSRYTKVKNLVRNFMQCFPTLF